MSTNKPSQLAAIIGNALHEKGWSQRYLAQRTGMNPSTVRKIAAGVAFPTTENVHRIARELGMPAGVLLKAAAHDAGYITEEIEADGTALLVAGVKSLPADKQRIVAKLVESLLNDA